MCVVCVQCVCVCVCGGEGRDASGFHYTPLAPCCITRTHIRVDTCPSVCEVCVQCVCVWWGGEGHPGVSPHSTGTALKNKNNNQCGHTPQCVRYACVCVCGGTGKGGMPQGLTTLHWHRAGNKNTYQCGDVPCCVRGVRAVCVRCVAGRDTPGFHYTPLAPCCKQEHPSVWTHALCCV